MKRPYKEFVERRLGKRIDYDKAYWYQCVDLIKQYADECLDMWKIGAIWNAKNVPNWTFWKKFQKMYVSLDDIMQWDIIVRTQWEYWHIGIVDHVIWQKVRVLEQNWSWKNSWNGLWQNAIRIQEYKLSRYQVILRNDLIVKNFNQELSYVDEKIEERANLLRITQEYKESLRKKFYNLSNK